jgi:Skp family chaperone for outer membrane proteins
MLVHPLVQVARGYLVDENWRAAEEVLGRAVAVAKDLEDENKRLVRELADAEERLADLRDELADTALYADEGVEWKLP